MILFLDRCPLYCWTDHTRQPPFQRWSVSLPVLLTDPGSPTPLPDAPAQRWVFDTAYTGEAFAWRHHLQTAGLDPDAERAGSVRHGSALGTSHLLSIRAADLWLVSNIPALRGKFLRIELDPGIAFRDVPQRPDPEFHRPLIGLRALHRAGVRLQIDFARATVSLWTPGPWHQRLSLIVRRVLSGYATVPPPW